MGQKISSTEKTKHRLVTELEDLQLEYERVHAAAVITEKRGRNFDKVFEKPELVLYVPFYISLICENHLFGLKRIKRIILGHWRMEDKG